MSAVGGPAKVVFISLEGRPGGRSWNYAKLYNKLSEEEAIATVADYTGIELEKKDLDPKVQDALYLFPVNRQLKVEFLARFPEFKGDPRVWSVGELVDKPDDVRQDYRKLVSAVFEKVKKSLTTP